MKLAKWNSYSERARLTRVMSRSPDEEDQMTDKTPIQRIEELDQERATLFEQAKEEALRRATQAVEDLNALRRQARIKKNGKARAQPA